jgi:hypothetical protein
MINLKTMNNTTLNYGDGIRQICLHREDLVFLDGCVLHIKERTLFEKDKSAKPSHLWGEQYNNPVRLYELDINEIGDLKLEIEEKYPEKSAFILSQLNIKP